MTTTATKIETKWDAKKIQHATTAAFASVHLAAHQVFAKLDAKVREEFEALLRQSRIHHFKEIGVKTPLDLVRAIAESEHNLFGSDIEISGDDQKATLKYNSCAIWNHMQKQGKFTPEQEKAMGEQCIANWTAIAKEFGFKLEPNKGQETFEMTFSK